MSRSTFLGMTASLWRAGRVRFSVCWGPILAISGPDAVGLGSVLALRRLPANAFPGGDVLFGPLGIGVGRGR